MSGATPYLKLACSNRGKHSLVTLARVTCTVGAGPGQAFALRGQALADFNAGSGPYAGGPVSVDVTTNPIPPPDGQPYKWNAIGPEDRLEVSWRADGQRVWVIRCKRCKRARKIPEAAMRRLGETPDSNVLDLSYMPW
ncbi:MAG: hypothetical protein M9886_06915 [Candidatus Nanopelagicales bacterium]|nr:hypothetical protein [Candidatus Nanopelagicales bacterium]